GVGMACGRGLGTVLFGSSRNPFRQTRPIGDAMFSRILPAALYLCGLTACSLLTSLRPTPEPSATPAPATVRPLPPAGLTVAWVENSNLMSWQESTASPRRVASGGVIRAYVAPDGQHVAYTRGPQG